jgi:hypothetical protein
MNESNHQPERELEIEGGGRVKRMRGLIAYLLLFVGVGGLLVFLFMRFTGSLYLAIVLVTFMMTYMVVMGWLAARRPEDRDS